MKNCLCRAALFIYLIVLAYLLFFSETFGRNVQAGQNYQYNLIPFKEITRFFVHRRQLGALAFSVNILGNIAAFIPLGFFLPRLCVKARRLLKTALISACFSFFIEALQMLAHVGSFDVDDIFLNTLGGILGYAAHVFMARLCPQGGSENVSAP